VIGVGLEKVDCDWCKILGYLIVIGVKLVKLNCDWSRTCKV